jgi:hypothetical protein
VSQWVKNRVKIRQVSHCKFAAPTLFDTFQAVLAAKNPEVLFKEQAIHIRAKVFPAMEKVREPCDAAEAFVPRRTGPCRPTTASSAAPKKKEIIPRCSQKMNLTGQLLLEAFLITRHASYSLATMTTIGSGRTKCGT